MSRVLEVPSLEADSFSTIDVATDSPEDPSEICQSSAAEESATKWWLAIASGYAGNGNLPAAIDVISTGSQESKVSRSDEDRAPFWAMLSWSHIAQMRAAPTSDKKQQFEKALELGNRAFEGYQSTSGGSAAKSSVPAVLAQAALVSAVGNFNDALQPFQTVSGTSPDNVFAKMGRARVSYARRNFRGALRSYQEVLRQSCGADKSIVNPDFWPLDPRIGIGLCFWHSQDRVKAKLAWERVVNRAESHPKTVAKAHAMLGAWYLDASSNGVRADFEANYCAAIRHFEQAYKQHEIPLPASKLASYLFSKHDMVRVAKLTDRVLECASMPESLAEASFWKARAAHYAGDSTTALTLYTQAMAADDQNVAAAIGKGIVESAQQRDAEAMLTFELVVQKFPKNADALFYAGVFGALQTDLGGPNSTNTAKSRELLEAYIVVCKAGNRSPRPEALVSSSESLERTQPVKAYEHLQHAVELLQREGGVSLPVQINLGVLAFNSQKYEEAEATLSAALDGVSRETEVYRPIIAFNLARVRENLGNDPSNVYSESRTVDAKARLLSKSARAGNNVQNDMKALVSASPENLEVRASYTWYLRHILAQTSSSSSAEQRELARSAAETETEFVKTTSSTLDKHDSYALVAMGNIYSTNAQQQPKHDSPKKQRAYMRAGEFFEKASQIDKYNAYAAQGVAIALAETKRSELAVPSLERIRDSSRASSVHVYINSGHASMEMRDYTKATEIYGQALVQLDSHLSGKAPDNGGDSVNRAELLSLSARAWLARGTRRRDVDELAKAVEYAQLAAAAQPDSANFAFNLAYVRSQYAEVSYRRPAEQRSLAQLELAQPWLEQAIAESKSVVAKPKEQSVLPFAPADVEEKLDHAESVLQPQSNQIITEQREHESRAEAKREEAKRMREEALRQKQEAEQRMLEERKQREAKLAEERERSQAQAAEWEAERERQRQEAEQVARESSAEPASGKRKGKKRSKRDEDDLIDDNEVPQSPSDSESSDEEEAKPQKIDRKQAVMDDDSSEDDDYDKAETENGEIENADDGEKKAETEENGEEGDSDDLF